MKNFECQSEIKSRRKHINSYLTKILMLTCIGSAVLLTNAVFARSNDTKPEISKSVAADSAGVYESNLNDSCLL